MPEMGSHLLFAQSDLQAVLTAITQGEDVTATEHVLEQRARTGDRQALLDLYTLLLPRMHRRARWYVSISHLPAHLDAADLVQEAGMVMYQRLEEAQTKEAPLAYLVATGYQVMHCLCSEVQQEPFMTSLDRPRFADDETPLHEYVPSSVAPLSPYVGEDEQKYAPLYQALARLPEEQQTVIQHYYGLQEHAPSNRGEIRDTLGWTKSRTTYQRKKTLAILALALQECYPQYIGAHPLEAHIPQEHRQRLDQAYAALIAQGYVSVKRLARVAKVECWMATAYLHEQGSSRLTSHQRSQQRLEQAYAELRAQRHPITAKMLSQRAHAAVQRARKYLKEMEVQA